MIKISIRDIKADLPPSVLRKMLKSRDEWMDIYDDEESRWTQAFQSLKNLSSTNDSFIPSRISWLTNFSHKDNINFEIESEKNHNDYFPDECNRFYNPGLDHLFICVHSVINDNDNKIKEILNIIKNTPFEKLEANKIPIKANK